VAVVGLPHDIDGEHPLAYVVIKTNQEGQPLANPQELIDFTNGLKTELFDATRTIFKTNELNYNQKK
jgi:acyl-coenzyme A synthetase/AMP-(fatty) acid ligase